MKKILLTLVFVVALILLPQVSLAEESATTTENSEIIQIETETQSALETLENERETKKQALEKEFELRKEEIKKKAEARKQEIKKEIKAKKEEIKEEREEAKEEIKDKKDEIKKEINARALERRSEVANAVAELLKVADREGGIGEKVREIAKSQNDDFDQAEKSLEKARSRSEFAKFFIGQNHKEIKNAQQKIDKITEKIAELNELKSQVTNTEDQALLDQNIQKLEQVKSELSTQVQDSNKGFSLFGWLFKLLAK